MAIWPFNKKKLDQSMLPDEVSEYYRGAKKGESRGSWVLALGTMLVTAVLSVVLFFGGRWVFQQIFDDEPTTVVVPTEQQSTEDSQEPTQPSDNPQTEQGTEESIQTEPQAEDTPATGGVETIPNTGPGPEGLQ